LETIEQTAKFSIQGVQIEATGENLSELLTTVKADIPGKAEFQNVQASIPFIQRWNQVQKLAKDGKIGLFEYDAAQTELENYEKSNFAAKQVAALRELTLQWQDRYGAKHKVKLTIGDSNLKRLEPLTDKQAYETLPWTNSEFSIETTKFYIESEKQRGGPPLPYSNSTELKAYLRTLNLKLDLKTMVSMLDDLRLALEKYDQKYISDKGERVRLAFLDELPEIYKDFSRAASEPSQSPSGLLIGEQVADTRLVAILGDLKAEAYMTAQMLEQEKGEGGFLSLLWKTLLNQIHKNDAALYGPGDE
jgi:hypothetical protein